MKNLFRSVDNVIEGKGDIYLLYNNWYLDVNKTKFEFNPGMNIDFKITIENNGITKNYYLTSIVQDRDF